MLSRLSPRDHRRGYQEYVLQAADDICQLELAVDVDSPRILHLQGLLLSRQRGLMAAAIASIRRSLQLEPRCAMYWISLGDLLSQMDNHPASIAAYLRAMTLAPESADLYLRLGDALFGDGRLTGAEAMYRGACRLRPDLALAYRSIGATLYGQGRDAEAVASYARALSLDPGDPAAYHGLGVARLRIGEARVALECFRSGLNVAPRDVDLQVGVGEGLLALGDVESAIRAFRSALAIDVSHVGAARRLAEALNTTDRRCEAAGAWFHLGGVYQTTLAYEESASAYRRALACKPDCLPAAAGLAHAYLACGKPSHSLGWLERVLPRSPQDGAVHVDLASAYHLLGDVLRGWEEFAHIYNAQECRRRGWECPLWDGSPLQGRTILLWPDMGRGDAIHFLRYIPVVKACGGHVLVLAHHPGLAPVIARVLGVDRVILPGTPLPHVDVHAPLNFFPAYFPALGSPQAGGIPYLTVAADLAARWRQKIGPYHGRTVGLSWGGNTVTVSSASRFVSLESFAPLGRVRHTRFVSLQHGPQAAELLSPPPGLPVEAVMDQASSIMDAAAVVLSMDLVITVDTMIAHLAGALGKPVWTLLRHATNWRWQHEGAESLWYPTMRLFRQEQAGDWGELFERVRGALEDWKYEKIDGFRADRHF